jgi:hypothetical protein
LASAGVGQPLNFAPPASLKFLSLAASANPGQIQGASLAYYQLLKFLGYNGNILLSYFSHGFFETRIQQAEQAAQGPGVAEVNTPPNGARYKFQAIFRFF